MFVLVGIGGGVALLIIASKLLSECTLTSSLFVTASPLFQFTVVILLLTICVVCANKRHRRSWSPNQPPKINGTSKHDINSTSLKPLSNGSAHSNGEKSSTDLPKEVEVELDLDSTSSPDITSHAV